MDAEDIDRFGTQRAAETGAPLINELAERLEIDLYADRCLALRMLVDLVERMFSAGYTFGATEAMASISEKVPGLHIDPLGRPPKDYSHPLGEGPEFDDWEPSDITP